jgi:hypothetical protein
MDTNGALQSEAGHRLGKAKETNFSSEALKKLVLLIYKKYDIF